MATLAADKPRRFEQFGGHPDYNEVPIIAADTVYAGAAVGESSTSGTGRPLVGADNFMGFCVEQCANEAGAASAKNIKVLARGRIVLTVTGVDNANDEGSTVYAIDDDSFSLTSTTTSSSIGTVERIISTSLGTALVRFAAKNVRDL